MKTFTSIALIVWMVVLVGSGCSSMAFEGGKSQSDTDPYGHFHPEDTVADHGLVWLLNW